MQQDGWASSPMQLPTAVSSVFARGYTGATRTPVGTGGFKFVFKIPVVTDGIPRI